MGLERYYIRTILNKDIFTAERKLIIEIHRCKLLDRDSLVLPCNANLLLGSETPHLPTSNFILRINRGVHKYLAIIYMLLCL